MVLMMRLPVLIERSRFDNGSGGVELGVAPHLAAANGPYDRAVSAAAIQTGLDETVNELLANGLKVVLVYPVPEMGWNIPLKLAQLARAEPAGAWLSPMQASVSRQHFLERSRRSYALLDAIGTHPDLARVYPERLFCRQQYCLSHDGAVVFYRDDNHLSRTGADRLTDAILSEITRRWGLAAPRMKRSPSA